MLERELELDVEARERAARAELPAARFWAAAWAELYAAELDRPVSAEDFGPRYHLSRRYAVHRHEKAARARVWALEVLAR